MVAESHVDQSRVFELIESIQIFDTEHKEE
jgi:hypothetical protein